MSGNSPTGGHQPSASATGYESEDDYMSMVIQDPSTSTKKESSLSRVARRKRENEAKARVKSKAEIKEEQAQAREEALAKAIDTSNKGFKMMAKLGFKPGMTLGKEGGRSEPVKLSMKEDRGGIGLDTEKKRKLKEEYEGQEKKVKLTEDEYRERRRLEREEQRTESQVYAAQKVTEGFDTEEDDKEETAMAATEGKGEGEVKKPRKKQRALRHINILWRGLARRRYEKEIEEQAKKLMQQSLSSRLPTDDDLDETEEDKFARHTQDNFEVEIDEEDPDLDEFNALPASERLEKLVTYLRDKYQYCFWCKYRYLDATMEGCPGTTEADHD